MGAKTTAKDMVKITFDLEREIRDVARLVKSRAMITSRAWTLKEQEEYRDEVTKMYEQFKKLTQLTYTEERIEQIVKQIIERSKANLIKLIQADEAFTKNERRANEILQILHRYSQAMVLHPSYPNRGPNVPGDPEDIKQALALLEELRILLTKDANTAEAVQIISRDLEKLMKTLRTSEQ